ncbi:TasA family protein [Phosphitispora fastidiosa]|uniref:TasA family protein n=1 Tax=Phosphitispora fastidiosa TaxID=2837202 RepID=UPI001E61654E|nr:TasA family protein [Phosphitispora fastidiosa]MBU7005673.1 putative ribosomally synthesized peptide with SipW-like signal peptide [Phosphitispora fastidiosa]
MAKRLIIPVLLVITVCMLIGGATFAYFTDTAANTGNTFTAGTIILEGERDLSDKVPGPMFYSAASDPSGYYPYDEIATRTPSGECIGGWAPGDSVMRAMNLYNRGTIDAKVTKVKANVQAQYTNSNDVVISGETTGAAYDEFIDKMNIKIMYPSGNAVLYNGPLRGLLNDYVPTDSIIYVNAGQVGSANVTFEATLSTNAGNDIQGKNFIFDFAFYAEQI